MFRFLVRGCLVVCAVVLLIAPGRASAGMTFTFAFDDNGFTSPLSPIPPIVGSGSLALASDVADGTYTLASLAGFTLSFNFADGDSFTQADIISDPSDSEVVIYNNGQDAYFTDTMPSTFIGGSLDFVNSNGAILSFSPPNFGVGFYGEVGNNGGSTGNYGVVPEPSSLGLTAFAGLVGLGYAGSRRGRRTPA